ncbi:hypothetical protein LPJ72_004274 [Coemansia sp. Benny D160-2]|nr:hypothetical protein LPJ72_004274 [Coemansia sp. Benny D160-2]
MLRQHRERQKKLLPLFSPELRATRMAFAKGLRDTFIIFTLVFWVSISFLYGSGYDSTRYIHEATTLFVNMDDSTEASSLSQMVVKAYDAPGLPTIFDQTGNEEFSSIAGIKDAVWRGDYWNAVVVNAGFGERLQGALQSGDSYDPTTAMTFYTEESRHYFKVAVVAKAVEAALTGVEPEFAKAMFLNAVGGNANETNAVIDRANPTALVRPYSYTVDNIAPYHFDMSMYILSVTLSLCMVVGSFIPSNMWKSIEEPFFKQVKITQLIALRLAINVIWAFIICLQATGIVFAFRGPSWSPSVGDFFAVFAIFLLNTFAFTFFIDCMQNWIHPKFLLGMYFTTLFVNIAGAMFGSELNNHFFRITYALPFFESGLMLRTLLTDGSYNKLKFAIPINILWSLLWWFISTFLIARKARLVKVGKMTMANVPPPPQPTEEEEHKIDETAGQAAVPAERLPQSSESLATLSIAGRKHEKIYTPTTSASSAYLSESESPSSSDMISVRNSESPRGHANRSRHGQSQQQRYADTGHEEMSDIEIEDA